MGPATLRRAVITVVVVGALVLLGVGFSLTRSDKPRPVPVQGGAVERLIPESGDLDLRQARIGVDLAATYEGALQVDGTEIPDDELQRIPGLNQIFFTPGPGKVITRYSTGEVNIVVEFWEIARGRGHARKASWAVFVT